MTSILAVGRQFVQYLVSANSTKGWLIEVTATFSRIEETINLVVLIDLLDLNDVLQVGSQFVVAVGLRLV